jgi:hypothetical protein
VREEEVDRESQAEAEVDLSHLTSLFEHMIDQGNECDLIPSIETTPFQQKLFI